MQRLVVTGASGSLGRRLIALLAQRATTHLADGAHDDTALAEWDVLGIDRLPLPPGTPTPPLYRHVRTELVDPDLKVHLHRADAVVHLAGLGVPVDDDAAVRFEDGTNASRAVFEACSGAGVSQIVVLSSSSVYGAWPDNPVPLAEDRPLRPNSGFALAHQAVELERLCAQWCDAHPSSRAAILRPAPVLGAPGDRSWLANVTRPGLGDRIAQNVSNRQYVHIDDVVTAIVHVLEHRLVGAFNVAPDGWISGDDAAALLGPNLHLPLPESISALITDLAAKRSTAGELEGGRVRGAAPYARFSWVVSNDRLKATGWRPASTSEESLVGSVRPSALRQLISRHRQEFTLGAVSAAALSGAGVAATAWRRWSRSR